MSTYHSIEPFPSEQDISATSTVQNNTLGTRVKAIDTASTAYGIGEFIYLKGLDSTAVGEVVVFSPDDWSTKLAVANDAGPIALAMSICLTSSFGWYQVAGKGVALVAGSFADDGDCYLTSTPGTLDDANVSGDYIRGIKGASAIGTPSTGLAEVDLWYASVADLKDD